MPERISGEVPSAPLVVVTGTGTGVGKTVVSCGLVSAWARTGRAIAGLKPIESGVSDVAEDVTALERVSTFHVKQTSPPPYLLVDALSPHLAARREGRRIDLDVITAWTTRIRQQADGVVLELAGGLFSPLTDALTNADLLRALCPSKVVLVVPDRLGVLHDVLATVRAARGEALSLDGIVLSAPDHADLSTGTNAEELSRILPDPGVLAVLPRASASALTPLFLSILRALSL